MEKTAELVGYFLAHAVWCVSDGEDLIPLAGYETNGKRHLLRFESDRLEEGVRQARECLRGNPEHATRAAVIYDAFATVDGTRRNALIVEAVRYGDPRIELSLLLPYSPKNSARGVQGAPAEGHYARRESREPLVHR